MTPAVAVSPAVQMSPAFQLAHNHHKLISPQVPFASVQISCTIKHLFQVLRQLEEEEQS